MTDPEAVAQNEAHPDVFGATSSHETGAHETRAHPNSETDLGAALESEGLDTERALSAEGVARAVDIDLTAKAVEMAKKALERRGTPSAGLRLGVRGGGCSGASYVIEFADKVRTRDNVYEFDGLKVVIDPKSLVYLRGSVLDYEVKLMGHGFKFRNPNEKKGCGCGESFSI